jgi:succinate-semialdehyde dehydrogenase/glutarate-semialdehyde dehydrogenase
MKSLANKTLFREKCFVNGEWIEAKTQKKILVTNPFDQSHLGSVPNCEGEEAKLAIESAHAAWPSWRDMTVLKRADILKKWAELIDQNKEDLATLMTLEQGKPLTESRSEMDYANSFNKWFAEEARRVYGDVIPSNKSGQHLVVIKQPVGVVAAITPWNFPSAMITRKCAPALAAGCPVVIKPASETPFSALALAALAEQAGFLPGVFNVITGDAKSIGAEMTSNPIVRKLSFTGSTKVGKLLMQQCSSTLKKMSLELGGNAPFIVFDDANLDEAVIGVMASKFRNTGQTCVCANRICARRRV